MLILFYLRAEEDRVKVANGGKKQIFLRPTLINIHTWFRSYSIWVFSDYKVLLKTHFWTLRFRPNQSYTRNVCSYVSSQRYQKVWKIIKYLKHSESCDCYNQSISFLLSMLKYNKKEKTKQSTNFPVNKRLVPEQNNSQLKSSSVFQITSETC